MAEYVGKEQLVEKGHPIIDVGTGVGTAGVTVTELRETPAADVVEVVRCKDCKHRPKTESWPPEDENGEPDMTCPAVCPDCYYSWIPEDDFFCARGERKK